MITNGKRKGNGFLGTRRGRERAAGREEQE